MNSLLSAVILVCAAIYALYFIFVQAQGGRVRTGRLWLSLTILFALLGSLLYAVPVETVFPVRLGRGLDVALILCAALVTFGALVISDVRRAGHQRLLQVWLAVGLLWLIAFTASALVSETVSIGQPEWLVEAFTTPTAPSLILLAGLGVMSLFLLGIAFYGFYIAPLPEIANRALFWVVDIAVVLIGIILMVSGTVTLVMLGTVAMLFGVTGALYALTSHRVFDIRGGFNSALRTALLVGATALIVFGALSIGRGIPADNAVEGNLLFAVIALLTAIVYVPVRRIIELLIAPLLRGPYIDPAQATRRYSQQVSNAVELDQLIRIATETLNDVLRVRRSGMLLVNDTGDDVNKGVELLVMPGGSFVDLQNKKGAVAKTSPIYHQLAANHAPFSQFDLEFGPRYREVSDEERQFFKSLQMSAYAPVIVENTVIGILACGPKLNDAPFYPRDLELLSTLANQTGVALRNARLVADLRHLNNSMGRLNKGLEAANDQLERLDSVKTDFVTIASHELRTPLAQIRGYTDILDALNDQGMLDQDQTRGMVANLRKATERMEELISAMLDVSQIDVNAMDLRFTQTTAESVVRLAIEPLTDAIKQRKLTLSARGLRGLPPIEADMQRLVQAIRNIVVNAIKFTPDGGRIEITASLQVSDNGDGKDHILIAIADTGVGIAPENLSLVFEKFFRAYDPGLHSTGTYKFMGAGPGLGLTIAKGVIEGHGGSLWAESPGHNMQTYPGATFYILLPVIPPEDARRVLPFESQHLAEKS
jgi:signal transduction histidine kinase